MKISINKGVFRKFPKLKMAFILVENVNNKSKLKESKHLLREMEQLERLSFNKDNLKSHQLISPWAAAQEGFGRKAKHYKTSVERLLHKVLKGKTTSTKDTLTNLVNYISLKNIVPVGVDDLKDLEGEITFAVASGEEKVGVLSKLKRGALFYKDDKGVLGTKLDYWKNTRTKLSPKSTSVLLHLEILPPVTIKKMNEITREATSLIKSFCGAKTKVFVLDKKKKTIRV
tara:strand:+ start:607 stop:1293 length:687 start_codon:yes stop_codon:yes gene_type:complete